MQIDSDNLAYLELLKDFWIQFCNQMQSIRDIFLYLERTYLISAQNREDPTEMEARNLSPVGFTSFWEIGLNFLRENIGKIDLKSKLIDGILDLIDQDRKNSSE